MPLSGLRFSTIWFVPPISIDIHVCFGRKFEPGLIYMDNSWGALLVFIKKSPIFLLAFLRVILANAYQWPVTTLPLINPKFAGASYYLRSQESSACVKAVITFWHLMIVLRFLIRVWPRAANLWSASQRKTLQWSLQGEKYVVSWSVAVIMRRVYTP